MLTFAVVVSQRGPIPQAIIEQLRGAGHPELSFGPDEHLFWTDESGRVAFGGWQAGTAAFGLGSHWSVDADHLTAFAGHLWPRGTGWPLGQGSWAEQLGRRVRAEPLRNVADGLDGVFSALRLSRHGTGEIVWDPFGYGIVYRAERDSVTVFSNRSAVAARLLSSGSTPARDPLAVSWLAYAGRMLGGATSHRGVSVMEPETWVDIGSPGVVSFRRRRAHPASPEELGSPGAAFDRAEESIGAVLDVVASLPASARYVDVTGGKDSRVVVAGLRGRGHADHFVARTYGPPDHEDVLIGTRVARTAGIEHRAERAPDPPGGFVEELARHVRSSVGMLSYTDRRWFPAFSDEVRLSGQCGEILRLVGPEIEDASNARELLDALQRRRMFDRLGVLRPEAGAQHRQWLLGHLDEVIEASGSVTAGYDAYYAQTRVRRWFGTGQEIDRTNRVFPLYSLPAIAASRRFDPVVRRRAGVHFELIRRWDESLLIQPLTGEGWDPELLGDRTVEPTPGPPAADPPTKALREAVLEQWRRTAVAQRSLVERLLDRPASAEVWGVFDHDACRRALLDDGPRGPVEQRQFNGTLVALSWCARLDEDVATPTGDELSG